MKTIPSPKKTLFTALLMFLFLVSSNFVIAQTRITISSSNSRSINTTSKNGVRTYRVKNSQRNFKIEYEGDITLSDDDKDIIGISKGGFIEIKKSSFGTKRRIFIQNESGTLVKQYFIGRTEKPYNPEGRKWLAEVLPEILGTTTIAAKSRVDRFYSKGGVSNVLNQVSKMESDLMKTAYIKLLLQKKLSTDDLVKTIKSTGEYVKSDFYISQILKSNQKAFLKNEHTITAYINAVKNIKSDHYITTVLNKIIEDELITDKQLSSLLDITKGIKSDFYRGQLLKSTMDNRTLNDEEINKILTLTEDIKSDFYKSNIYTKIASSKNLSESRLISVMESASNHIRSSFYLTNILVSFANQVNKSSEKVKRVYRTAAKKIKPEMYYGRVLKALN